MKITLRHWYLRSLELKSARIARDLIKGEEVDAAIKAATVSSKNRVKRKKKKCVLAQQLNTTAAMPATIEEVRDLMPDPEFPANCVPSRRPVRIPPCDFP